MQPLFYGGMDRVPIRRGCIAQMPYRYAFESVILGQPQLFGNALRILVIDQVAAALILKRDLFQMVRQTP